MLSLVCIFELDRVVLRDDHAAKMLSEIRMRHSNHPSTRRVRTKKHVSTMCMSKSFLFNALSKDDLKVSAKALVDNDIEHTRTRYKATE